VALFSAAIASPTIINKIKGFIPAAVEKPKIVDVVLPPPPVTPNKPVTPPPPEPPKPRTEQVRFPPPVVRPDADVHEKDPPTDKDLVNKDPGPKDQQGDPNAAIRIDEPVGDAPKTAAITEENNTIFVSVEQSAEYPGGIEKFYDYLGKAIHYPAVARENGVQGKVILTFVVEKDGSLTDIKVLRGIGSGCDEEAQRVVKASKKWRPGKQNGQSVRQQYTVPIAFTLAEN